MVSDLTGLPLANASLLDEGTAASEAMTMFFSTKNRDHDNIASPKFFVDENIFVQTKDLLLTRSVPVGIELVIGDYRKTTIDDSFFGAIVQYPDSKGSVNDYRAFIQQVHAVNAYVVMATDLLSLTLLTPPGELGADVAIGSAQRFGVPMGFGGPHAAFFTAKDDFRRSIPGRIIGVSIDAQGNRALRMALQTREQHIKREKATSNICTAQALLANMAAMYAVYHGPEGLKNIAKRVSLLTRTLSAELQAMGFTNQNESYFDTIRVTVRDAEAIRSHAEARGINFFYTGNNEIGITLDETTSQEDIMNILTVFGHAAGTDLVTATFDSDDTLSNIPSSVTRTSDFLTHPVFNSHHS